MHNKHGCVDGSESCQNSPYNLGFKRVESLIVWKNLESYKLRRSKGSPNRKPKQIIIYYFNIIQLYLIHGKYGNEAEITDVQSSSAKY